MTFYVIELERLDQKNSLVEFEYKTEELRNAVFQKLVEDFDHQHVNDQSELNLVMLSTNDFEKVKHARDSIPKEKRIYKFFPLKDFTKIEDFLVEKSKG